MAHSRRACITAQKNLSKFFWEGHIAKNYKYQAFISYAHEDETVAARLQTALEKFPVPKPLRMDGMARISPIFRDVTELTAHHSLSRKIEDAVNGSRFLIVLCSPAAKNSHWVNEEIRLFRRLHGAESILCALIEGTPSTSFPDALLEMGHEPLAANLSQENFQLGTTQLAASILNVGLDDLVQREAKRRRRRLVTMTAGSVIFSGLMAMSTFTAIKAKNDAELSRNEAENLVEFMLSDLKEDLEPIGKLNIIDSVGDKISDYYEALSVSDMDDEHLARRARAMHILGQVANVQGNNEKSLNILNSSFDITAELMRRSPESHTALSSHAQSESSLLRFYESRDRKKALSHADAFKAMTQKLYDQNPSALDNILEHGWANNKLGQIHQSLEDYTQAENYFSEAKHIYELGLEKFPNNEVMKFRIGIFKRNLALIQYGRGAHKETLTAMKDSVRELEELYASTPDNFVYLESLNYSRLWAQHIQIIDLKVCKPEDIYDLISGLETSIENDQTNNNLKYQFIDFSYKSIKECSSTLRSDWKSETIDKANIVFQSINEHDENLIDIKKWLDEYQAK